MAVENGSLEQVPPDLNHAPEPSFIGPAPKVITFDCYGALVRWYEVLLDEG
jgi:2-haloacid dehalogenase